jgi:hypothetical protein
VRFLRWVWTLFKCPNGWMHSWEPFQVEWRARCPKCGLIVDHHTKKAYRGYEDYIMEKPL